MSHIVNKHIRDTPLNITEWCKKEDCWNLLKDNEYTLPKRIAEEFIPDDMPPDEYDPTIKAERELIDFCVSKGSETWWELAKWLKTRLYLTPKERSQCGTMAKTLTKGKKPSGILSRACKNIWDEAILRGWSEEKT